MQSLNLYIRETHAGSYDSTELKEEPEESQELRI